MNLRQTLRRFLPDRQQPRELWDEMLGLLLPPTCRLCDRCVPEGDDFCEKCEREFRSSERVMQSACPRCGRPGAGFTSTGCTNTGNLGIGSQLHPPFRPPVRPSTEAADETNHHETNHHETNHHETNHHETNHQTSPDPPVVGTEHEIPSQNDARPKSGLSQKGERSLTNSVRLPPNQSTPPGLPTSETKFSVPECQACQSQKLHFDGCIALWVYHDLVREAVVASKYGSQVALADALGRRLGKRLLSETIAFLPSKSACDRADLESSTVDIPDLITCVPSHFFRRVSRGAGGSRVIADAVHQLVAPHWPSTEFRECLATTRRIQKQAWLGEKERVENIRGAFKTITPSWRSRQRPFLTGKHVLLVDDVMTTGATANEIAKTLKQDGARRVTVGVVARATGH